MFTCVNFAGSAIMSKDMEISDFEQASSRSEDDLFLNSIINNSQLMKQLQQMHQKGVTINEIISNSTHINSSYQNHNLNEEDLNDSMADVSSITVTNKNNHTLERKKSSTTKPVSSSEKSPSSIITSGQHKNKLDPILFLLNNTDKENFNEIEKIKKHIDNEISLAFNSKLIYRVLSDKNKNILVFFDNQEDKQKLLKINSLFSGSHKIDLTSQNDLKSRTIIIKNLSYESATEELEELLKIGITEIASMKPKNSDFNPNLVKAICVDVETRNKLIKEGVYTNNQKFKAEPFLNLPKQCLKCKDFGHIASSCTRESTICGLCAGNHGDAECESNTSIKCANCNGNHNAYYRGCQKFKDIKYKILINNNPRGVNNPNKFSYAKIVSQQDQIKQLNNKVNQMESNKSEFEEIKAKIDRLMIRIDEVDEHINSKFNEILANNNSKIISILETALLSLAKSNNLKFDKDLIAKTANKLNFITDNKKINNLESKSGFKRASDRAGSNAEFSNDDADEFNANKSKKQATQKNIAQHE